MLITRGDGRVEKFTWTGTAYDPSPGVFSGLVKNGDGSFDLTEKDQTVYHFDSLGRLTSVADRSGNTTTLTYPGTRLTAVTGPRGRSLSFTYDANNHVTQVTDPLGRTLGFTYDGNGDLVTVTDVRGFDTTFTYDANHRLLTITDANGHTFGLRACSGLVKFKVRRPHVVAMPTATAVAVAAVGPARPAAGSEGGRRGALQRIGDGSLGCDIGKIFVDRRV